MWEWGKRETVHYLMSARTNDTEAIITGSTSPLRVTSPVMAVSDLTHRPVKSDTRTVTIVTPADGPSLPTAPAGKCM